MIISTRLALDTFSSWYPEVHSGSDRDEEATCSYERSIFCPGEKREKKGTRNDGDSSTDKERNEGRDPLSQCSKKL